MGSSSCVNHLVRVRIRVRVRVRVRILGLLVLRDHRAA